MKLGLALIALALNCQTTYGQLVVPSAPVQRAVVNAAMVIMSGGQKLEVLPNLRAIRQTSGQYATAPALGSDVINQEKLGVAYSFAINSNVFLSGEVSFKVRPGTSSSLANAMASGSKVLVPPNVYVTTASTPAALVTLVNQLQTNPAVEWVEAFTVRGKFN